MPIDEPAKRVDIPPFSSPHAAAQRCGGVCDAPLDVGAGGRGGASSVRPPDSAVDASNAGRRDLGARGAPPDSLQATGHWRPSGWLRQDSYDGEFTHVRRKHCAACRVKGA